MSVFGGLRWGPDPICPNTDLLTFKQMCEIVDSVPDHTAPPPLVLPSWFPKDQLEYADRWATNHGWGGVVVSGHSRP